MGKHLLRILTIVLCIWGSSVSVYASELSFSEEAIHVICNIIYAVETGGQVYGNADYGDVTEAGTNTENEKAITIGAGQFYADSAKVLLDKIRAENPSFFAENDTAGIGDDLDTENWSTYKISKNSDKAKCISKIISSDIGIKAQDELMYDKYIKEYVESAVAQGVKDKKTAVLYIECAHVGGVDAAVRHYNNSSDKSYEGFYSYLIAGNPSNSNAVNGSIYKSRHEACKRMIDEHEAEILGSGSITGSMASLGETSLVQEWNLVGMPTMDKLTKGFGSIKLPDSDSLYTNEKYSLSVIKNDILSTNSFNLFDKMRVTVVFLGLLLVVYSIILVVAYMFDRVNNLFEISLLGIISFGALRLAEDEDMGKRKGYMTQGKVIKMSSLCLAVGLFIISGGVFSWAITLIYTLSGVL